MLFLFAVGSFASVYVARHVESSVSVAIKVVDLQRLKAINSKLMTHLQSEIDVMRGLRHRNIVRLFDIAMEEPNLYMVLEMCRFGDMSKYVQAQPTGRLDEQRARFFAMQVTTTTPPHCDSITWIFFLAFFFLYENSLELVFVFFFFLNESIDVFMQCNSFYMF